jgi:hypothetical protein
MNLLDVPNLDIEIPLEEIKQLAKKHRIDRMKAAALYGYQLACEDHESFTTE